MSSATPDDRHGSNVDHGSFSHVRIGSDTSVSPSASQNDGARFIDVGALKDDPWHEEAQAAKKASESARGGAPSSADSPSSDALPDYGLEDLPPMPLAQKIILFVVILAIVAVAYFVIRYWIF